MAAETGFMIDGELLEVPGIDTFNMDEAQILYDYSGLTLEDFARPSDVTDEEFSELIKPKMKNPGFVRALMHIAYQRANPRQNPSRVKALIGQANMIGALEHLAETGDDEPQEGDGRPPELTTELEQSSLRSSVVSNGTSGDDSPRSSDEPDDPDESITTPGSDTSSTSRQELSAA